MRGNSTAGNPEVEPLIVGGSVATCICTAVCGRSPDCITAGSFRIFVATREARVFGGFGGGLSMLHSESSLKIPPCSFVDFLVLEG
jgi:hypothetical protein